MRGLFLALVVAALALPAEGLSPDDPDGADTTVLHGGGVSRGNSGCPEGTVGLTLHLTSVPQGALLEIVWTNSTAPCAQARYPCSGGGNAFDGWTGFCGNLRASWSLLPDEEGGYVFYAAFSDAMVNTYELRGYVVPLL